MSGENLAQVFAANPITTNTNTDLMYFAKGGVDVGMTYANFAAQFPGKTGAGASGTWAINISGNAATSTSAGSVPVSGITGLGTGVATALAINVGSTGAFVNFNGAGGTPSAINLTNGTGLPLTTGVTGILPTANGGTGIASPTANAILIGEGASPVNSIVLSDGEILIGNTGGDPSAALLTAGSGITITPAGGSITISASGSSGTPIQQQLWVNSVDGNDSNAGTMPNNALATYDVGAYPIILANASPTNQYVVWIIGNSSVTSNFSLLPYCTINIVSGVLTIPGQLNLDTSYSGVSNSLSTINGSVNASGGIELDYGAGDQNLVVLNIDPTTTPSLIVTSPNTNPDGNLIWLDILPNTNFVNGVFQSSGLSFTNVFSYIKNVPLSVSAVYIIGTGAPITELVIENCSLSFVTYVDGSAGSAYCQISNSEINDLELIGTSSEVEFNDSASYPANLTLSGGAVLATQVIVLGSTDGLAFSSTFSPVNFSLVPGNWRSNSTTAAFAGIDVKLGTIGSSGAFTFTYDSGNSSGITGTPVLVYGSYFLIGDYVSVNATIDFTPTSATPTIAFQVPFVTSFPLGFYMSATASIFTATTPGAGAIGLAVVIPTTTSVKIPMGLSSSSTPATIAVNFTYKYQ